MRPAGDARARTDRSLPVKREQYLHRLNSTHLRSIEVRRYVELPINVAGRSILDIGSGTSTASMDFARAGARVVALDLRFRDIEELKRSSGDYFECFRSNLDDPVLRKRNPTLVLVYQGDREDSQRFFRDVAESPCGCYVAGDLWKLPFADNSFDFVVSIRCLADCYVDPDIFVDAASEALRVVKPGSLVQISPWQADYLSLGRGWPVGASARQQETVLASLRSAGINYRCKAVRNSDVQCLQLLKR
jgi:SAM-dependent methyltransferase